MTAAKTEFAITANASVILAFQVKNAKIKQNAQKTAIREVNAIWANAIATMVFRVLYAKIK